MENLIILESVIGPQITGMDCETGDHVIAVVTRERAGVLQAMLDDADDRLQQNIANDDPDEDFTPVLTKSEFFRKEV
ncbi:MULTISPECIES: hypothetical protein [Lacticaseibacillus]|uniref:Uncharacterized protein n=2 Tax=Lacticaseibacillus manihotivorans TaxID=88233 RepID=A0A0R1QLX1_9LACO|nr:hypothetical protein [Lacticaseibacillus manihotivorans]KRL45497.1 hypothetical protein FD01_GL000699 [Lacticaseibacillus manihotivorans DSM 13343 = JCM 12514]QFQ90680.1 hypothetical protein LM010_04200 [Lacticaseibacillus manihotivorans]